MRTSWEPQQLNKEVLSSMLFLLLVSSLYLFCFFFFFLQKLRSRYFWRNRQLWRGAPAYPGLPGHLLAGGLPLSDPRSEVIRQGTQGEALWNSFWHISTPPRGDAPVSCAGCDTVVYLLWPVMRRRCRERDFYVLTCSGPAVAGGVLYCDLPLRGADYPVYQRNHAGGGHQRYQILLNPTVAENPGCKGRILCFSLTSLCPSLFLSLNFSLSFSHSSYQWFSSIHFHMYVFHDSSFTHK